MWRSSRDYRVHRPWALMGVLLLAGSLWIGGCAKETEGEAPAPAPEAAGVPAATQEPAPPSPEPARGLVGRWLRPDGGYLLDILAVADDGTLQAAYHNPRPIHVSEARHSLEEGKSLIFIKLDDVGYPGATYSLVYREEDDTLAGDYFQPTAAQTFDVVFVRVQ